MVWGVQSSSASNDLQAWCQSLIVISLPLNHLFSCSSSLLINASHHLLINLCCRSSSRLIIPAHHCFSSFAHHSAGQPAHQYTCSLLTSTCHVLSEIIIILNKVAMDVYWTKKTCQLSAASKLCIRAFITHHQTGYHQEVGFINMFIIISSQFACIIQYHRIRQV